MVDSVKIMSTLEEEVNRWMNAKESRQIGNSSVVLSPSYIYAVHNSRNTIDIVYSNGALYDDSDSDESHVSVEVWAGDDFNGNGYWFNHETSSKQNTLPDIKRILERILGESFNNSLGQYFKGHMQISTEAPQMINGRQYISHFRKMEHCPATVDIEVPEFPEYNKKEMKRIAKKLSYEFSQMEHVADSTISYKVVKEEHHFVSSEGSRIATRNWRAMLAFTIEIKDIEGRKLEFVKTFAPKKQEELLNEELLRYICANFYKKAAARYDCPRQETGEFNIIMDPDEIGVLFHEGLAAHLLSARYILDNNLTTFNLDKLNKQIIPEFISLYDDPMLPSANHWSNFKYDDEGMRTQRKLLVENGILRDYLTDRNSAAALSYILGKKVAAGNSRRNPLESNEPEPRISNLDIETSKPKSSDELKRELMRMCIKEDREYGILTEGSNGGHVNASGEEEDDNDESGVNVTFPNFVYRIYTDGRIIPVKLAHTVGSAYNLLNSIQMLGTKKTLFTGTCGATSGPIPVSMYSMSGLLKKVEIGSENPRIDRRPLLTDDEDEKGEVSIVPGGLNDKE